MFGSSNNSFDPNKDIPDLSGKVYIVTGGSAGIGYGISAHLIQHNCAALYLLGNKEEHLAEAEEGLKSYGDASRVHSVQVNLQDLTQTDQVARELASKLDRLDALICNAGLGVGPFELSKDGLDSHMQVNHISQFHLTMILLPLLQKTSESRLVHQSSEYHRFISTLEFDSVEELNTDIGPSHLYARTKLAQILFIRALAQRKAKGELGFDRDDKVGPWLIATHPGGVVTDQQDQAVEAYGTLGKLGVKAVRPFMKDPVDEGCRPVLFAATSEDVVRDQIQGQYIVPDRKITEVSKQGRDERLGENLWKLTEKVLANKLGSLPYGTKYL